MRVSAIVCSRNRAYTIGGCLDSIAASLQAAAPVDAEIVVVDNGSTDGTSAVVRKWMEQNTGFPLRLLHEPRKGVSYARNMALREAKGDLLVWTDDDCRLSRDYVRDALRHDDADTEPVLRGGKVEIGDPTDLPLTITMNPARTRWHKSLNSARHENLGNCLLGCNMAMRRSTAREIGFFDESLGPGSGIFAGEDTDYIFRAYTAGIALEYVPDMLIYHHHGRKTREEGQKLFRGYMVSAGALYAKHVFKDPNLARQFLWDVKNAVKDVFVKRDAAVPEIGFSNAQRVAYATLGACKYAMVALKGARK